MVGILVHCGVITVLTYRWLQHDPVVVKAEPDIAPHTSASLLLSAIRGTSRQFYKYIPSGQRIRVTGTDRTVEEADSNVRCLTLVVIVHPCVALLRRHCLRRNLEFHSSRPLMASTARILRRTHYRV